MVSASTKLGEEVAIVQAEGVGDIVIFGNSIAKKAIDVERLETSFKPTKQVSSFASDGTNIPHWYTLLVGEVYEKGFRPAVVVIYANAGVHSLTILETPRAESEFYGLPASSHPLVVENYFEGRVESHRWRRIQASRYQLRNALLDAVVEHGTAAFLGALINPGFGNRGRARQELDLASQTILFTPEARIAQGLVPNPDAGGQKKAEQNRREGMQPASVDDTLLPHFVALARTYGARTVLVRSPLHPRVRPTCSGQTGVERFVQSVSDLPLDVIDLTYLPIPAEQFTSSSHIKPSGQPVATEALAQALVEVGAFDDAVERPLSAWAWPCSTLSDQQVSLER